MNTRRTATTRTTGRSTAAPSSSRRGTLVAGVNRRPSTPLHETLAVGLGCTSVGHRMSRRAEWE